MSQHENTYDYVVIGGGTAGSVIASRLTENPDVSVAVIEGGPSDVGREDVLTLRRWTGLLGGELDYDYPTTEQPRGNSHIRHSRARVLGGCSSHNTLIAFKPLPSDWDEWEAAGAKGWGAMPMEAYWTRLLNNIVPVDAKDRNAIARTSWTPRGPLSACRWSRASTGSRSPRASASSTSRTTRRTTRGRAPRWRICTP